VKHGLKETLWGAVFGRASFLVMYAGVFLLIITQAGNETYITYKRTLRILEARKALPEFDLKSPYCNKVGIRLAKERYEKFVSAPVPRNVLEMP